MENKIDIDTFANEQNFSNAINAEVFKDIATNHTDETPRQILIRAIVGIYERNYPAEMRALAKEVQKAKELSINEFSADKEQDQRRLLKIPQSLWNRMNFIIELLKDGKQFLTDNEEIVWFMKSFPEFRIPNQI